MYLQSSGLLLLLVTPVEGAFDPVGSKPFWSSPLEDFTFRTSSPRFWDYELMPAAYYGIGVNATVVHPLKVADLIDEDDLARTLLERMRQLPRADPRGWRTHLEYLTQRIDGFPGIALAYIENKKRGIIMSLTTTNPVEGIKSVIRNQVQWDLFKDVVQIHFGDDPLPYGDVQGLYDGVKPLVLGAYKNYVDGVLARTPARHVGTAERLLRQLSAEGHGILNLRRDLLCVQFKITNEPKVEGKAYTERYYNRAFRVMLGQVLFVDPSSISSRQRVWDETLPTPKIAGISPWSIAAWEPRAMFEPEVERFDRNVEAADESKREGKSVQSLIRERLASAPDFVCPQEVVLSDIGYSDHCVHMGVYSHHAPESLGPAQQFALRCAAMFPVGTVFVAYNYKQIISPRTGRSRLVTIPVMRVCNSNGWSPEMAMSSEHGTPTIKLCHEYLEHNNGITANDIVQSARGNVKQDTTRKLSPNEHGSRSQLLSRRPQGDLVLGPDD